MKVAGCGAVVNRGLVIGFLVLFVVMPCAGRVITVDDDGSADFNTIQAAIDDASEGDTIVVQPGMYYENVQFNGTNVVLTGTDANNRSVVNSTVIDGNDMDSALIFSGTEDASCVVAGLTITGGLAANGGGISGNGAGVTISRCVIRNNKASANGGGIFNIAGAILNCVVSFNTASSYGGGIYNTGGGVSIVSCELSGNVARRGGGIFIGVGGHTVVFGCTIVGNNATDSSMAGGGIYGLDKDFCTIKNSILWNNRSRDVSTQLAGVEFAATYCDVEGVLYNIGNRYTDPCFVQSGYWDVNGTEGDLLDDFWVDGDYHLRAESVCIDTGDPNYTLGPGVLDMDGESRLMGLRVDMGADEFVPTPTIRVTGPQAGDVWAAGSERSIDWETFVFDGDIDILFSSDGGWTWQWGASGAANTGRYLWSVPGSVDSDECVLLALPHVPDWNTVSVASEVFEIKPFEEFVEAEAVWKTLGGDFERRGLSDVLGPELGCVKWVFDANGPVSGGVTVGADGRVHIPGENGVLYTVDSNGVLLWSYDVNSMISCSPTIGVDGTVYVGGEEGKIFAVGPEGEVRWTFSTSGPIHSSPAVGGNGQVYVCSQTGTIYWLGQDGSELWAFEANSVSVVGNPILASSSIGSDGTVYVPALHEPNLYALDGNDGSVKWVSNFEVPVDPCDPDGEKRIGGWIFASPVVGDGVVYQILAHDTALYAVDANSGAILWWTELTPRCDSECVSGGNCGTHCPSEDCVTNILYYVGYLASGETVPSQIMTNIENFCSDWYGFEPAEWGRYEYLYGRTGGWSEPVIGDDGTVYVSLDDPYLRAVEPNGTIKWVAKTGREGGFTLAVEAGGYVYAADDDGYLTVVDANGQERARFVGEGYVSFPVVAAENTVIISDANGKVWAIEDGNCVGRQAKLHRAGDIDMNRAVDFADFATLAADYGDCTRPWYAPEDCIDERAPWVEYLAGDLDRDTRVTFADYVLLAKFWMSEDW